MTENTVSNAVATRDNGPSGLIRQYRDDFAQVLPSHIKADQWVRITQGVLRRDPQLAQIAQRNPGSFLAAVLDAARLGLEVGDTYHLVAFGNEIQGIADYTGLIELIYRAGAVSSVKVEVVYDADHFRYEPGEMDRPEHRADWFGTRGNMIGAYAYGVFKDGSTSQVVIRSKAEIEQVKAVSRGAKSPKSPWNQWPDRMWKKTVIRELSKFVPTSAEYVREQLRAAQDVANERALPGPPLPLAPGPVPDGDDAGPIEAELVEDWPETAAPGGGAT